MHTVGFGEDRAALSKLSAVSSGVGLKGSHRTASNNMGPAQTNGPWRNAPTPIRTPKNGPGMAAGLSRSAAFNPYNRERMSSNLGQGRNGGSGSSGPGNLTASKTVLDDRSSGHANGNSFRVPISPPPTKRRKIEHDQGSRFFQNGGAGTGNGKDKAPAEGATTSAHSEPTVIPDSDEERVGKVLKGEQEESTPDPIDCIDDPVPSTSKHKSIPPLHDFDRSSDDDRQTRLPRDGPSTRRLRETQARKRGPEAVDVEVVAISDDDDVEDIESASGFDQDDSQTRKEATPNGRQNIPQGAVRQKITMYELKEAPRASKQTKPSTPPTPTIDLMQHQSQKAKMKPRNAKQTTVTSLPVFNKSALAEQADAAAISLSGFKTSSRKGKSEEIPPLPVECVSLGCHLIEGHIVPPTLWLSVRPAAKGYTLFITPGKNSGKTIARFSLDNDFSTFKLTSTKNAKFKHAAFEAGSKWAPGQVSLKFLSRHAEWDSAAYKEFVALLKNQVSRTNEILRGAATKSLWQTVEDAAKLKAGEHERHVPRQTRSNTSSAGDSTVLASSTDNTSTSLLPKDFESIPAPLNRTYAAERRVTRQSAHATRKSNTPENLDELVLVYPPSGTGAVNITRGDLRRLDNGQYLNDTLIEFGLKLWLDNLRSEQPELAEQVHVFNSFFYKKLNSKKEIQDSYPSVRKWTSKVDIFKKKYIIVPINENFHWYLAIIINPAGMLHPPPLAARAAPQTRKRKHEEEQSAPATDAFADKRSSASRSDTAPSESSPDVMIVDAVSEGDQEVESMLHFTESCIITDPNEKEPVPEEGRDPRSRSATRDSIDLSTAELQYPGYEEPTYEPMDVDNIPGLKKESKPPDPTHDNPREESSNVDKPTPAEEADAAAELAETVGAGEDGLQDDTDTSSIPKLGKYLQQEALDKKGYPIEKTRLTGSKAVKGPMQQNFCDCGLFVLAFVEAFMKDPLKSMECIQAGTSDWYTGSVDNLREVFREKTIALSEAWKKERAEKEGPKQETASDKPKPPEAELIDDSDDEIVVGEIIPASKPPPKSGKKPATGKAMRVR
ncbi:hypothetical protein BN946_scf184801.g34 [Trametes cinnabarina]|uniref:Ubiquitin-like protease family profile domain-containing protein n=1 Tax=Pycnoporus cinnabarinus TaxID=5643 RepID=A0A060S9F9_PYCCI|nr:hypothetical protein BN946_scf184801.g34 [Trametes cinnabarina]